MDGKCPVDVPLCQGVPGISMEHLNRMDDEGKQKFGNLR